MAIRNIIMVLTGLIAATTVIAAAEKAPETSDIIYGKVTIDQLFKMNPTWASLADAYQPDSLSIDYLKHVESPVAIQAYYGYWCSDSETNVPKLIKTLELAKNASIEIEFWNVARKKEGEERPPVNGRKLQAIPTFVVLVGGTEMGTIVENPKESVEKDLVSLIKQIEPELP